MKFSSKYFHFDLRFRTVLEKLRVKLIASFFRLTDVFRLLPIRVYRVFTHIWDGIKGWYYFIFKRSIHTPLYHHEDSIWRHIVMDFMFWWGELYFLIMDCLGISEIYETLLEWVKFNSRPLFDWEVDLARSVFGESLNYKRIRIDEYAIGGPKQKRFAYVSFYHINCWGAMQNSLFIHELIHVWQYEHKGALYILRALRAQYTKMGYNYGGTQPLLNVAKENGSIFAFNYEQQGDIVADYFRIRKGYEPQWGRGTRTHLPIYEYFMEQIRNAQERF